jgi:hypothetical protein
MSLMVLHLAVGAWGWHAGGDRLAAIVAGSIYVPLWPFDKLGLPVFGASAWFFPPLTYLGWGVIGLVWMVAYWYIAGLISRLLGRFRRLA